MNEDVLYDESLNDESWPDESEFDGYEEWDQDLDWHTFMDPEYSEY